MFLLPGMLNEQKIEKNKGNTSLLVYYMYEKYKFILI